MKRKTTSEPERRNFVTKRYIMEHYGVTEEWLKNARERAAFPFYKPQGTNTVFYRPQDIDAYIEKGRVV